MTLILKSLLISHIRRNSVYKDYLISDYKGLLTPEVKFSFAVYAYLTLYSSGKLCRYGLGPIDIRFFDGKVWVEYWGIDICDPDFFEKFITLFERVIFGILGKKEVRI